MANVLAELTEQLAKKVGGDDMAKSMVEMIQAEGGTRSTVQKKIKNLLKSYDASDAIIDAKDSANAKIMSNFVEEADGQMTFKAAQRSLKEAKVSNFAEGSDGQMYIVGAEPSRSANSVNNNIKGQMSISDYENNMPIKGQQSFVVDEYGNLNSEYGIQQQQIRKAEVDNVNRSWIRKRLDNISSGINKTRTGVKNAATAASDGVSKTGSNIKNIFTGEGDAANRLTGRKTREAERIAANQAYIETGQGSAQSKRQFFKNYKPNTPPNNAPSSNASNYDGVLGSSEVSDVADTISESGAGFWDGIPGWAKGVGIGTAGIIAGGIIFDDDE